MIKLKDFIYSYYFNSLAISKIKFYQIAISKINYRKIKLYELDNSNTFVERDNSTRKNLYISPDDIDSMCIIMNTIVSKLID